MTEQIVDFVPCVGFLAAQKSKQLILVLIFFRDVLACFSVKQFHFLKQRPLEKFQQYSELLDGKNVDFLL